MTIKKPLNYVSSVYVFIRLVIQFIGKAGLTDHQIDALVYELYRLTDEEIKIVEGS